MFSFPETLRLQIDNSRERERVEQSAPEIPRVEVELEWSEMSASAPIFAGPCGLYRDVPCRQIKGGPQTIKTYHYKTSQNTSQTSHHETHFYNKHTYLLWLILLTKLS